VVADPNVPKVQRKALKNELAHSYWEILEARKDKPDWSQIVYTYGNRDSLSAEHKDMVKDLVAPFAVIIGHQVMGDPFLFVSPGQDCCQQYPSSGNETNPDFAKLTKFVT